MRNSRIDFLRAIGLLMIVAAHLSPPALIHQLRNFDVPLMVLISGASFQISFRDEGSYTEYLLKRLRRLVLPVWAFLTVYFGSCALIYPEHPMLSAVNIGNHYLLSSQVSYVWIIRVFLIVALAAPFLYRWNKKISSHAKFFFYFLLGTLAYSGLWYLAAFTELSGLHHQFMTEWAFYLLPYGLVFLLGIRLTELPAIHVRRLFYGCLATFLGVGTLIALNRGGFVPTQEFKYPAGVYYLSYALMVSMLLWQKSDQLWEMLGSNAQTVLRFASRNSIWIYLWHIPLVRISKVIDWGFWVEFPVVLVVAGLITFLQVTLLKSFIIPRIHGKRLRTTVRTVLTG